MFKKETDINLAPINTPVFACFRSGQKRVIIILQDKKTLVKSWIYQDECYVIPTKPQNLTIDYFLIEIEEIKEIKEKDEQ